MSGSRKTFVLDTSVLIAAGRQPLFGFSEHEVIVPLVVLTELEGLRNDPERGLTARSALRALEELRVQYGEALGSDEGVEINDVGGRLHIETNHVDQAGLPPALRSSSHDTRILAVALNLRAEGRDVTIVSQDLPMRVKATAVLKIGAEEYRNIQAKDSGYTGIEHLDVVDVQPLYDGEALDAAHDFPVNTGVVLSDSRGSALGRVSRDKSIEAVRGELEAFGVRGKDAAQRIALAHLLDDKIGIVSLGGTAGTGKTFLALAAGLEAVMERRTHERIVVFRSPYAVGGQELGFLPGTEDEKMAPWAAAVYDALSTVAGKDVIEEVKARGIIEVLPLTHVRGRTFTKTWMIVDESQNLERSTILTALSRTGEGSKVVLSHDLAQRDNLRVGRHDGIHSVVEALKGEELFAHVTFTKSHRSKVAALVTRLLDGIEQ